MQDWQQRLEHWHQQQGPSIDNAHDLGHLRRVWSAARLIMVKHPADELTVLAASYLHDIVNLPKNHPDRAQASYYSAREAVTILARDFPDFPADCYPGVAHAIETHSYSAQKPLQTLEAKILQDADRLDALGAIGLARMFSVSGAMGAALFDDNDPLAAQRPLDDKRFALDHLQTKLFALPGTLQTDAGRALAFARIDTMVAFLATLYAEIPGDKPEMDARAIAAFCGL